MQVSYCMLCSPTGAALPCSHTSDHEPLVSEYDRISEAQDSAGQSSIILYTLT